MDPLFISVSVSVVTLMVGILVSRVLFFMLEGHKYEILMSTLGGVGVGVGVARLLQMATNGPEWVKMVASIASMAVIAFFVFFVIEDD